MLRCVLSSCGAVARPWRASSKLQLRSFAKYAKKGSDPLLLLQQDCHNRGLCNEMGQRLPGVDWRIVIAMSSTAQVPNVRTVNIERVSAEGIDFVLKRTSMAAQALGDKGTPLAFLHTQGKFLAGQSAEQWRGEGFCVDLELDQVLDQIPLFTINSIVSSIRLAKEQGDFASQIGVGDSQSMDRAALGSSKSHLLELMQRTKMELENGQVSKQEMEECIRPFRLQPDRVECMVASPDAHIMWDRWEWLHESTKSGSGDAWSAGGWKDSNHLVPH